MKKIFLILSLVIVSLVSYSQALLIKDNLHLRANLVNAGKNIELVWTIRMEDHVDYYQIEFGKSPEALDSIAKELGGVWSIDPVTYRWYDKVRSKEPMYYRIKAVYWDGVFEYSNIVDVVPKRNKR